MSKVRMCDVCGNVIKGKCYTVTATSMFVFTIEAGDICQECVEMMRKLRKEREDGSHEN